MNEYIDDYLAHYGILGQRWGVRRYQHKDGTLTEEGIKRYRKSYNHPQQKYTQTQATIMEAKYRGKRAIKNASKSISKKANAKLDELKEQRKASKDADQDAKTKRLREKMAKELGRPMSEIKTELGEMRLKSAQNKVNYLQSKSERIKQKADLKAQERILKKEIKDSKKNAEREAMKRYTKNDIKRLSDEDLNKRINRLKNESTLRKLEAERAAGPLADMFGTVGEWAVRGAGEGLTKIAGAQATKMGKKILNLTDEDINLFVRLTKKK